MCGLPPGLWCCAAAVNELSGPVYSVGIVCAQSPARLRASGAAAVPTPSQAELVRYYQAHVRRFSSMFRSPADTRNGGDSITLRLEQLEAREAARHTQRDDVVITVHGSASVYHIFGLTKRLPKAAVSRSAVLSTIVQTCGATRLACSEAGFQAWLEYLESDGSSGVPDGAQQWASLMEVRINLSRSSSLKVPQRLPSAQRPRTTCITSLRRTRMCRELAHVMPHKVDARAAGGTCMSVCEHFRLA